MIKGEKPDNEKIYFAPGCALMIYKPGLVEKIHHILNEKLGKVEMLVTCCQHNPELPAKSSVINVCPGCDKRYRNNYEDITTSSLWEIINENSFFGFPDYKGMSMSIIDACPTREVDKVQDAIRALLQKMNISLLEPENTRRDSSCCGDIYYGSMPTQKVKELMIEKAVKMPVNNIVVHCVSCIVAVCNGDRNPRYLADLLFNEETLPKTIDLDEWHKELNDFIEKH